MPSPVEVAVETYIRAASERDPQVRARLLEACFAENGRMVTRSREIRGRAALIEDLSRFLASPRVLRVRVTSAVDAQGTTFRYVAVAKMSDGTRAESFDAGEIDADGRISLILTFAGPLLDAAPSAQSASRSRRGGRRASRGPAVPRKLAVHVEPPSLAVVAVGRVFQRN